MRGARVACGAGPRAIVAAAVLLGAGTAPRPAAADVIVESRGSQSFLGRVEYTQTERTGTDARSTELCLRQFGFGGKLVDEQRRRIIVRLDRGVVWTIDDGDSSYNELTFELASRLGALLADSTSSGLTASPVTSAPREHGRIAGSESERFRFAGSMPSVGGSGAIAYSIDAWITRAAPACANLQAFDRRFRQALPAGATGVVAGRPGALLDTVHLLADSLGGCVMRYTVHLSHAAIPANAAAPGARAAMDSKLAAQPVAEMEVTAMRSAATLSGAFELPPGFRRRLSDDEQMLELLETAAPADSTAPAPIRKP